MLSMEIEVANIAYIATRPNTQNSPNRRYFFFQISAKNTNITLQRVIEQQLLKHGGITTNQLKKIIQVKSLKLALRNRPCRNP